MGAPLNIYDDSCQKYSSTNTSQEKVKVSLIIILCNSFIHVIILIHSGNKPPSFPRSPSFRGVIIGYLVSIKIDTKGEVERSKALAGNIHICFQKH